MTINGRREDWWGDADVDRAHIFVPAIMSAGIVLSLFTLVRDAVHGRRWQGRERRVALSSHAAAEFVLTGAPAPAALTAGLRPRASYAFSALAACGLAMYVLIGATLNYLRPGGYVADIAWLWSLSVLTSVAMALIAGVSTVAFVGGAAPPTWLRPLLVTTPLGQRPAPEGEAAGGPSLFAGWLAAACVAAAALFTLVAGVAPHRLAGADNWVAETVPRWDAVAPLAPLDLFGETWVSVLLVAAIGVATLRCPPFALVYLASVGGGLALNAVLKVLVPRDRPPYGSFAAADSFPSGHEIQAMLIGGFLPIAVLVLTRRRWLAWTAVLVLVPGIVGVALSKIYLGLHWWSDVVAGFLWGAALLTASLWALSHRSWHRQCRKCPWSARVQRERRRFGVVRLPRRMRTALRWSVRTWVPTAVIVLLITAVLVGVPANPEGDILASQVEQPVQLGMLGVAALAWALAWRWEAAGAVLLALAGTGLGALAAVAYHPTVSVAVTAAFLLPAAAYWLLWQHQRTVRALVALAVATLLLLVGTGAGATAVYDHFFGPAHPASALRALPEDQVVWAWTGGVTGQGATVVTELRGGTHAAVLIVRDELTGTVHRSATVVPGADRVARLTVGGLVADTRYTYVIEADGAADQTRGRGSFRTMPVGPASFTAAFGSCARTGSSGAVFDAIRAARPLVYMATGDLHYGNPSQSSTALFEGLYRRTLTAPAQAALFREVPVAYVWDDHDYGPNNADATAPTRGAARDAYRRYAPHYPLPDRGAIYQAFTAGRVRFVLTDTRSERTATSMLGDRQRDWLIAELASAARTHALVVWVNPDPWIAPADPARDDWGGFADERRRIAEAIASAGIGNLVMVAGDAHMVAIDDGSHSGYAAGARGGFPILHAAALDRPGSVKGGPYSEGAITGAGQFGTVAVDDTGGASVGVTLTGRNWRGETLLSYRFTTPPTH